MPRRLELLRFLGRAMGKAIQDEQRLPLHASRAFFKLVRGDAIGWPDLTDVVADFAGSMQQLSAVARGEQQHYYDANGNAIDIEDLGLTFRCMLPGLHPLGDDPDRDVARESLMVDAIASPPFVSDANYVPSYLFFPFPPLTIFLFFPRSISRSWSSLFSRMASDSKCLKFGRVSGTRRMVSFKKKEKPKGKKSNKEYEFFDPDKSSSSF